MGVDFTLASTRTFGDYADLAYVSGLSAGLSESERLDLLPLKALDRVAAGFQLPGEIGSLGIGAVHIEEAGGDHSYFMTASFNRPFFFNSHLSVSGFAELNGDENFGVGLFLSAPLGGWGHGGAGLEASKDGVTATADVAKARGEEPGSYGWRVHARQDEEFAGRAALAYRASMADMEVSAGYAEGSIIADAYIEGGLAVTPDGIFPSRRIDDAFAIVDTGAPDVRVFLENRPVGRTNKSGKLLVTGLNSYETNRISIEPDDLPLDAEVGEVERLTVPADRSGARVSFGVKTGLRTALIVIEDSLGKPIPAGTRGTVEATKEAFVVGYGGEVYLKDLSAENVITLDLKRESCNAVFNFKPGGEAQTRIEGVVCE
jgi:outer membrane usher protein